jgi:hypothetical protein
MGLSSAAAAAHHAKLHPDVQPDKPPPQRGHARANYVDSSRTDGAELRGVGLVGRGIEGAIVGSRPGRDRNIAREERDNQWLAEQANRDHVRRHMRAARAKLRSQTPSPHAAGIECWPVAPNSARTQRP